MPSRTEHSRTPCEGGLLPMFGRLFPKTARNAPKKRRLSERFRLTFEHLEDRVVPAGTVTLTGSGTTLNITGDGASNHVAILQDGAGTITILGISDNVG